MPGPWLHWVVALPWLAACAGAAPHAKVAALDIVVSPEPPMVGGAVETVFAAPVAVIGPPVMRPTVKRRATFFAYSRAGYRGAGGHWKSDNLPRLLGADDAPTVSAVALLVLPLEARDYHVGFTIYAGYRVVLANGSQAAIEVVASDSRVPIVQEALDADGTWRAIEYLPESFCGNSYHTLVLQPGEYWDFVAPRYAGSVETMVRIRAELADGTMLTTTPMPASIDPRQFADEEGHRRTNIMDPYLN